MKPVSRGAKVHAWSSLTFFAQFLLCVYPLLKVIWGEPNVKGTSLKRVMVGISIEVFYRKGLVMANKEQKAKPSGKREAQLTLKEKRAKKAEKKKS